jgi:DNA-directed RNA polymerase subunit M/transcription elongation factor TFIIS
MDEYTKKILHLVKPLKNSYEKRQQLLYNLQLNGDNLRRDYTPEQLVELNDDMLLQNSPLEQKKKQSTLEFDKYQALLQKDFLQEHESVSVMVCSRCNKGGINFNTKQVSAADEGSTTFCACPHCGLRWRMS